MSTSESVVGAVRPSWGQRLVGVEGLRAVAATSILVLHAWIQASPDGVHELGPFGSYVGRNLGVGLTLFFTLSGFLLYRPFAEAILEGGRWPGALGFLRRRALRILPAYWAILLSVAFVLQVARRSPDDVTLGALTDPVTLLQDLLLVQSYTPGSVHTGIGPAWSLVVEAAFYLALPVIALMAAHTARGRSPRGRLLAALLPGAMLLAVGVITKLWASGIATGPNFTVGDTSGWDLVLVRSFLYHADLFAFGMTAAVVMLAVDGAREGQERRLRRAAGGGALVIGGIALLLNARGSIGTLPFATMTALACGLVVLFVVLRAAPSPGPVVRLLESRAFVFAGVISYSLYLWHEPLTGWLREHGLTFAGPGGVAVNVMLVFAVSAALATLTYRFVEAPALRRKTRFAPRMRRGREVAPEPAEAQAAP
jgi:peptidoglycan/LPS O-acetylase OafA/YrhL